MTKKVPEPTPVGQTPPPKPGISKPPKPRPNEINLTELIDEYIRANKHGKNG